MLRTLTTTLTLLGTTTLAGGPTLVTDIPPVQAIVTSLMQGVGTPQVIVDKNADPHHLAMRPSHARAISGADLIVWIGPELTPWFEEWIQSLAPDTASLPLIDAEQTVLIEAGEEESEHDEHDHGNTDPHVWLDPANASGWATVIAGKLDEMDPDNAAHYQSNLAQLQAELTETQTDLTQQAMVLKDVPIVVGHDSWAYLAKAFDLNIVGHLTDVEDAPASPQHLAELKEIISHENVGCMIAEPGQDMRQIKAVFEDRSLTIVSMSPMGQIEAKGTETYSDMLKGMVQPLLACAP